MSSPPLLLLKAREGLAVPVLAGARLKVINRDGGQVVDMWAVNPADPDEHLSMEHTRTSLSKLVPAPGDHLYSSRRRPMLTLVQDTSPGVHDTLIAAAIRSATASSAEPPIIPAVPRTFAAPSPPTRSDPGGSRPH